MFTKLKLFWEALQEGKELANATAWKKHQITANKIAGFLVLLGGLLAACGHPLPMPIDNETAMAIGGGLLAIVNWLLTASTSTRVGLSGGASSVQSGEDEHRTMSDGAGPVLPAQAAAESVQPKPKANESAGMDNWGSE